MTSMVIRGIASLIPGAQPIGTGMISVGGKMALGGMLAKTALDVVNESTRKNGMSDEAAKAIIKEAAINAGSFVVGMGAGATGAKVGASLLANGSSKLVSVVAERGVDFTISVLGDMAMIGNFNVEGNMMGVVTATALGLKTGKNVMKNHLADEAPTAIIKEQNPPKLETKLLDEHFVKKEMGGFVWAKVLETKAKSRPVQEEVGKCLDALLYDIPNAGGKADVKNFVFQPEKWYKLPSGDAISVRATKDNIPVMDSNGWATNKVRTNGKSIVFQIIDKEGNKHLLPVNNKENMIKALKMLEYIKNAPKIEYEDIVSHAKNSAESLVKANSHEIKSLTRSELKEKLENAKIDNSQKTTEVATIKVPASKGLAAPSSKFAETDEAFENIIKNTKAEILLISSKNGDDFIQSAFNLCKSKMGLSEAPIKLKINDDSNSFDQETATVNINRKWKDGDKAELIGAIAHEI